MKRALMVLLFVLGMAALSAAQPAEEGMKPISAAEGEHRVAEVRDLLANMLWDQTEAYWHNGRWEETIAMCRRIVEVDPHFVEAYNGAAWMLWSMDRDEEAIELYRAGTAANPDRYEVYHDFGMYYYHRHKWEQAIEQFRKSVECGAPPYMQHMLPNTMERAGKKREAVEEWRALQERFPGDPIPKRHIDALEEELKEE